MFKLSVYDLKTTTGIFKDMISNVVLPSQEGQLAVWDFHQPMLACLRAGEIEIGKRESIKIKRGIVRAAGNEVVVFVEK